MAANTVQDILRQQLRNLEEGTITLITKLLVVAYGTLAIGLAYLAHSMDGPVTQLSASVFGALGSPILAIILLGASVPWANKYGALAGAAASLTFNLWMSLGRVFHGTPAKPLLSVSTRNCSVLLLDPAEKSDLSRSQDVLETDAFNSYNSSMWNYAMPVSTPSYPMGGRETFFLYNISYEWYTLIGCLVGIGIGLAVSFLSTLQYERKKCVITRCLTYTEPRYILPCLRNFWGMRELPTEAIGKEDSIREDENTKGDLHKDSKITPSSRHRILI